MNFARYNLAINTYVRDARIELALTARGMKGGLRSLSSFCGLSMRARGIEPLSNAWEAFILPLNYARKTDSLNLIN